jgi:hypothetical protein
MKKQKFNFIMKGLIMKKPWTKRIYDLYKGQLREISALGIFSLGILCIILLGILKNVIIPLEEQRLELEKVASIEQMFNEEVVEISKIYELTNQLSWQNIQLIVKSNIERMKRYNELIEVSTKTIDANRLIKSNKQVIALIQSKTNETKIKDNQFSDTFVKEVDPLIRNTAKEWNKIIESWHRLARIDFHLKLIGFLLLGLLIFWNPINRLLDKQKPSSQF